MKEVLQLGLTPQQIERRKGYIGASEAKIIAKADPAELRQLWLEKRGEAEPKNLDDILAVAMGMFTEPLNAYWTEKQLGIVISREGESVTNPDYPWAACTLDGFVEAENAVWQAKHVSGFEGWDVVVDRYFPQVQHEMAVTGAQSAYLTAFLGSAKWKYEVVPRDDEFIAKLMAAEEAFWACVLSGEEPAPAPIEVPQSDPRRVVDMTGHNMWAAQAASWLENRVGAALFNDAAKELKALIEADVKEAKGHGIVAKKDKRGAIRISEEKK